MSLCGSLEAAADSFSPPFSSFVRSRAEALRRLKVRPTAQSEQWRALIAGGAKIPRGVAAKQNPGDHGEEQTMHRQFGQRVERAHDYMKADPG